MIALRWTCVLVLALFLAAPAAAQDGQCSRCGVWVGGVGEGQWIGMSRAWRGLCERCRDPERRCDQALDALRDRIREAEAWLQASRQEERELLAAADADALFLAALQAAIRDTELQLAEMRALLARLERECAAQGASDMAQGLNPGTRPGTGSNEPRDAPTGTEPLERGADVLDHLNPGGTGSDGSNVGRDSPTRATGSQASIPSDASPEAAYLQGLRRYAAARPPLPRGEVRLSEQGLPEPVLAEVPRSQPPLERADVLAANAVAYAEAFDRTQAEAGAALQRGDRERALALLEHALVLAAEGQSALRDAQGERVRALRDLQKLARLVTGRPADVFAAWLAQLRAQGLPAERLPGLTPEQLQEVQAEVLAIDPREAAVTHYRLQRDERTLNSKPPDDAEWDLASVSLAHRIAGRRR